MAPKSNFVIGEKVLCFHGPLLYEAKCLKKENKAKDKKWRYFVHYSGWKKNWDEWVLESRVLKFNAENLQKQKELSKLHTKSKRCTKKELAVTKDPSGEKTETSSAQKKSVKKEIVVKKAPTKKPETPKPKPAEKKTESFSKTYKPSPKLIESKGEDSLDNCDKKNVKFDDLFEQRLQIENEEDIVIDYSLQDIIWEDYHLVNKEEMVVRLPARFTVERILTSYVISKMTDDEISESERHKMREFAEHIKECFEVLLWKTLLYATEDAQYLDIHENQSNKKKSEIYGATHLLRMFCKLDELLKGCNPPGSALTETRKYVQNFIWYLAQNLQFFYERDYIYPKYD